VPPDLREYLLTLISPPDEKALYMGELPATDWPAVKAWPEGTVPGIIIRGSPTAEQSKELLRVLKPGAHLLLIAPDAEPTGHTGACTIEDNGFEIRDAILWVREAGEFHYVPKAARSEREAGCEDLPGKTSVEAVGRDPESAGAQNPRAGAGRGAGGPVMECSLCHLNLGGGRNVSECPETTDGQHKPVTIRTADEVHNWHPTVKAIGIMEKLLWNVPQGEGPVLDPFMGSGTTGLACIKTGHDFLGIEREEDFVKIATARVEHWKEEVTSGVMGNTRDPIEITSDRPHVKPVQVFDLFAGMDD
jgi:hypothetical protein